MIKRDFTDPRDNSRVILFQTPCGYEIALIRRPNRQLKIQAHNMFGEYVPDFLVNHEHLISGEGAAMMAEYLGKMYARQE